MSFNTLKPKLHLQLYDYDKINSIHYMRQNGDTTHKHRNKVWILLWGFPFLFTYEQVYVNFYIDNAMAEISMRNKFVIDADEVLLDNFVGIKQVYNSNWICH